MWILFSKATEKAEACRHDRDRSYEQEHPLCKKKLSVWFEQTEAHSDAYSSHINAAFFYFEVALSSNVTHALYFSHCPTSYQQRNWIWRFVHRRSASRPEGNDSNLSFSHLFPQSPVSFSHCTRITSVPVCARDHETHVVHLPVSHLALGQLSWCVFSRFWAVRFGRFFIFFSFLSFLFSSVTLFSSHSSSHQHSESHLVDPLVSCETRPSPSAAGSD